MKLTLKIWRQKNAKNKGKIVEYPIHYRARVYGSTQISRFKDGFRLLLYFINSFIVFNSSKNIR